MITEAKVDLKYKDNTKGASKKSKKIKKKENVNSKEKKKQKKTVVKDETALVKATTSTTNGGQKHSKHSKEQKPKNKAEEGTPKDVSIKLLAKKEKKKAKKLAKKIIKKQMIEGQDTEVQNKETKVAENTKISDSTIPKTKQKKNVDADNKESKPRDPIQEAATIFVGNLPVNTKRVQLLRLFSDFGPVNGIRFRTANGKILFKHKQRKEAGTLNAWVVLKDAETAKRALALNGTVFKNNHLRITSSDLNKNCLDVKRTIFVGNLKYSANEEKLREIFSSCGDIDYIRCLHDDKGCKGVAYVCFKTPEAVGLALELNETMLDERPINVERYSVKKLGAKKARESDSKETKKVSGSGKKLINKRSKDSSKGNVEVKTSDNANKKSKYRGVKVDGIKKKPKKKITSQMQKLAKKIAPKKS